jgi:hypothetical protein
VAPLGDSLVIRARLVRDGNAAFIGTLKGTLTNETNQTVGSFAVPVAVYRTVTPRFALGRLGLAAGRYRLALALSSERVDLAADQLVRAAPVSAQVDVVLP